MPKAYIFLCTHNREVEVENPVGANYMELSTIVLHKAMVLFPISAELTVCLKAPFGRKHADVRFSRRVAEKDTQRPAGLGRSGAK